MEPSDRFFGVNNRTILYELGLKPGKDDGLITQLAQKVVQYVGGDTKSVLANEGLLEFLSRSGLKTPTNGMPGVKVRPRYIKNTPAPSRCKHLLTVQLIRQLVYPRWLSEPYPEGPMIGLPAITGPWTNVPDLLSLGMPLLLDLKQPLTLPGCAWRTDQITDVEAESLTAKLSDVKIELRNVHSFSNLKAPEIISSKSIYQQLDPAWGLYLEGVFRHFCAPEKGQVSMRGRHLLALELAQLTPILDFLEADSRFQIYGWGGGRIHLGMGMDLDPEQNLEELLQLCSQKQAYVFSRDRTFIESASARESGFLEAYARLLQSGSKEKIESVVSL